MNEERLKEIKFLLEEGYWETHGEDVIKELIKEIERLQKLLIKASKHIR